MARRKKALPAAQPESLPSAQGETTATTTAEAEPVEPEPVESEPSVDQAPAGGFAAQHTPRATEASERPQSHAAGVGRRTPRYNDQGISDKLAGATLLEHHDPFFSIIRFEEKPSDAVRAMLRESEFRWHAENKEWNRPIRFDTRQQDRIDAERVFEEVCKTIRAERGITHEFGGSA